MNQASNKQGDAVSAFSVRIQGRVQGVGFRYSCFNRARGMGLLGWVRNTSDGAVEVWSEGPQEKQVFFLKWLHQGPPGARVDSVQCTPQIPTGKYRDFSITY